MKTYNFTVEIPESNTASGFLAELNAEIENEGRQLDITTRINKETTKAHLEVLKGLVDSINKELLGTGLEFKDCKLQSYARTNGYICSVAYMRFGIETYELMIKGQVDRDFKDSKYTTYTGKYSVFIQHNNYDESRINPNAAAVLESMRHQIKDYLVSIREANINDIAQ